MQSSVQTSADTNVEPRAQTSADMPTASPAQTSELTDLREEPPMRTSADALTEHPIETITDPRTEPIQSSGSADGNLPRWIWALRQLASVSTDAPALDDSVLVRHPSHHELCRLYRDCLQHLRGRYAATSLVCSVQEDLQKTPLWNLPVCFGSLANFMADVMPLSPSGQEDPTSFDQY
ncbi:hypothetical protein ONZ51_g9188 [Trametes cubensis]|uniref:Uncharacterized protein n=1 Tax=Trametes cubensis TaxID=1111947 RepID=A0AAD7X5V7_9APHY|nr:hypothetical protein ONZ51_g9188 [Trametes cubensis]